MSKKSTALFTIGYSGDALENNTIDVRELAPALLALGGLIDESNKIVNENKTQIKVCIKATSPGSFNVVIEAVQEGWNALKDMFLSDNATAIISIKEILLMLFGAGGGLICLIRKLKGKTPETIENLENGKVKITYGGGSLIISKELLELYKNIVIRASIEGLVKPLRQPGIDTFSVKENKEQEVICEVKNDEVELFDVPSVQMQETVLNVDEREMFFSLVSISFKDDNKWRLDDGNSAVNVSIKDEVFINKIKGNEIAFAHGDTLKCKVKITQKQISKALKTEYEIIEVIEHISGYKQLNLF
jgi:hypothetical protein